MKKIFTLFSMLFLMFGFALQAEAQGTKITSLTDLNNDKVYSLRCTRDYLGVQSNNQMNPINYNGAKYLSPGDDNMFAILKGNNGYYLYSTTRGMFVPAEEGTMAVAMPNGAFDLIPYSDAKYVDGFEVISQANRCWMMLGGSQQFLNADGWDVADDGDIWFINEEGDLNAEVQAAAIAQIELYEGMPFPTEEHLTLNRTELSIVCTESAQVVAIVSTGVVTWTSSNTDVATVDADGIITAKTIAEPTATAVITATWGDETAECVVTVMRYGESVSNGVGGGEGYITALYTEGANQNLDYTNDVYCGDSHYQSALDHTLVVAPGQQISLTFVGNTELTHMAGKAWLDWNCDGCFDPENEFVFAYGTADETTESFATGETVTFLVPTTVTYGESRLRMVFAGSKSDEQTSVTTYGTTYHGFTIDFSVTIEEASAIKGLMEGVAAGAARYYDLQGRRVLRPVHGVYVTETGKKILK